MITIFTLTQANMDEIIGYAGTLVGDVMPLLVVIIGIAIGGFVIKVILNIRN